MATLILKISDEEHSKIKAMAALSKQTMKSFILNSVFSNKVPNQETLEAFAELEQNRSSLKKYDDFKQLLHDVGINNA